MKRLVRTIIPAAGAGTRMGLAYPKTLHRVAGIPILGHILRNIGGLNDELVVVVAPSSEAPIKAFLRSWYESDALASTVVQPSPVGMADAVRVGLSAFQPNADCDYLIVWGDQATVRRETLVRLLAQHRTNGAWLTFPTCWRSDPYTHVERNDSGEVRYILELREEDTMPIEGENDCGVFLVRGEVLATGIRELEAVLLDKRDGRYGRFGGRPSTTGEFSFLPLIELWARQGRRIEALLIAQESEALGVNTPEEAANVARLLS